MQLTQVFTRYYSFCQQRDAGKPADRKARVNQVGLDQRLGKLITRAMVREELGEVSFSGTIFVFRAKRTDRVKIVAWDGSGLILFWKRLEHGAFKWPPVSDGVMRLTASQLAALVDGMDWSRLHARETRVRPRRRKLRLFESH